MVHCFLVQAWKKLAFGYVCYFCNKRSAYISSLKCRKGKPSIFYYKLKYVWSSSGWFSSVKAYQQISQFSSNPPPSNTVHFNLGPSFQYITRLLIRLKLQPTRVTVILALQKSSSQIQSDANQLMQKLTGPHIKLHRVRTVADRFLCGNANFKGLVWNFRWRNVKFWRLRLKIAWFEGSKPPITRPLVCSLFRMLL